MNVPPKHLADLTTYRKRQAMTEQLRRELVKLTRRRVKAVGRHVQKEAR